jgi:CspA family cold shock protein
MNSIFEEIITNDNLESEKIIEFMKIIENEIAENHWNEVFCMITAVSNSFKIPQNTTETIFLTALRDIHNCIRCEPELNKIQKILKNLTSQIKKISREQNLREKNINNANEFNEEIERFGKIFARLKEQSDIESSLKNYVLYRLMTFFEFKSYDVIKKAIDSTNNNQTNYGKSVLGDGTGILHDLNKLIILVLENTISKNKDSTVKLNPDVKFFEFLNQVIEITSPDLKKYFDENYNGDWFTLIDELRKKRNDMAHSMSDADFEVKELEWITDLMKIFFFSFPQILLFMIQIIPNMQRDEQVQTMIEQCNQTLNTIDARIISVDNFYETLQKRFDLDFYNQEFEKNKQTGTFRGFNPNDPSFGFIKREGDEDLFVHKTDVKGTIEEGDSVEFLVGKGKTGRPAAKHLKKIT